MSSNVLVQTMRRNRAVLREQMDALLAQAEKRSDRNLTTVETTQFDGLLADLRSTDARILELEADAASENRAAATRLAAGEGGEQRSGPSWTVGRESATYRPDNGTSFFRDLRNARRGDGAAIERLQRNNAEVGQESRALGNTGATGGSGGEFSPPGWIVDSWVKMARPGRVTADLFHHEPMPSGVSSLNLPKISGGSTVANQTTQNTTVSSTDITTSSLSSGIVTIAGKQVVSQQLLDQSAVPFDRVVLEDLVADYSRQLGAQVITGSGASGILRGYLTPSSTNVVTWTQATPTAGGFYAQLAKLQGQINSTRFTPPDTVVMHPRRWAWLASYTDSTGRPLVVPTSGGFNSMANPGSSVAAGHVGSILGMDVFTDPNIPQTLGAGTNQDVVLMFPREDIWLWESDLRAESFDAPLADAIGVLFRVFNYAAMIPDRYLASLGQISGTGLVAPTFAS